MSIDTLIMRAIEEDDNKLGISQHIVNYIVATGIWKMDFSEDQNFITFTDDFKPDAQTATMLEGCEVIEGERLLLYTAVEVDDRSYGLVLFKENVYSGGNDEPDVS